MFKVHFKCRCHDRHKSAIYGRKSTNGLNCIAHSFATATHDAFVHFPYYGWGGVLTVMRLLTLIMKFTDSQFLGHRLKVAISTFGTYQAVEWMVRKDEFHHRSPCIQNPHGMGIDLH